MEKMIYRIVGKFLFFTFKQIIFCEIRDLMLPPGEYEVHIQPWFFI